MNPATKNVLDSFHFLALPTGAQEDINRIRNAYASMAHTVASITPEGPELTRALVLLRQSKDAAAISVVNAARERMMADLEDES